MRTVLAAVLLFVTAAAHAAEVELPFEIDRAHSVLLVTVAINDKPALMILDTGATTTMIAPALAGFDDWALKRSKFVDRGAGLDGHGLWAEATVALAGVTWRHRRVGAVDLQNVREAYGRPIDGLLGQDLLREFKRVSIDYERRVVVLTR